jgi:fermentation-respiration switch protein FrsA (DUF1100 family)
VSQQPADATFVLSSFVELSAATDDPLSGHVDRQKVFAAGHSLGAMTTVGLFNECCRDGRLDGGIVLAGNALRFPKPFAATKGPLLFVHGDRDATIPISSGKAAFDHARGPKAFVTLEGAGHITPYIRLEDRYFDTVTEITLDFLRWARDEDNNALNALREAADSGFAKLNDDLD